MKRSHLYAALTLSAAFAIAVGVCAGNVPILGGARAAESPYSITDTEYDAAILESYDIGTGWSYSQDKPLGNHSLPAHIYGDAGDTKKVRKVYGLKTGVNETFQWRFSAMDVKYLNTFSPGLIAMKLINNSTDYNIQDSTKFPEADYPDEYAIGQYTATLGNNRAGAIISNGVINDISDFTFHWRDSYLSRLYVMYQLDGETEWKILWQKYDDPDDGKPVAGNISGTRGWDTYGFTTFELEDWDSHELNGSDAKIAIVIAGNFSESFQISAIRVNTNKAAVRYLNTLSYKEGVCSTSTFDLRNTDANGYHAQSLFQFLTENADGSFLGNYTVNGLQTHESTALGLYNHLVSTIPGLGSVK